MVSFRYNIRLLAIWFYCYYMLHLFTADGLLLLQVRADRIQYDLEELIKALTERCKKHGLDMKSAAIIELPTGMQVLVYFSHLLCCFS